MDFGCDFIPRYLETLYRLGTTLRYQSSLTNK